MHIFPPYKKWVVPIKNPSEFNLYLKNKIEFWHTNKKATLKGKLNEKGFRVQLWNEGNMGIPVIRGKIVREENSSTLLILNIQSHHFLKYILIALLTIAFFSGILSGNFAMLFFIPFGFLWLCIPALIFHYHYMSRIKCELNEIIEHAKR